MVKPLAGNPGPRRLLAFVLLIALTGCVEPPDPHLARRDGPSEIELQDGRVVTCDRVQQTGISEETTGWECRNQVEGEDWTEPVGWWPMSEVKEVRAARG
jgi:hypothetical protein